MIRSYDLLALDIDGTLLDSQGQLRPRTREAIRQTQATGVQVTLATGRRLETALPVARTLNIQLPLILHNGASIQAPQDGRVLMHSCIPAALVREAVVLARKHGLSLFLYEDPVHAEKIYFEDARHPRAWEYHVRNERSVQELPDLLARGDRDALRLVAVDDADRARSWEEDLRSACGDRLRFLSGGDLIRGAWVVEVFGRGVDKGTALEQLAARLGVDRERILAMGDWENDLEMIQYAGLGIAMGNAPEHVKLAADRVTFSNDEDGVATVIEEHVLGHPRQAAGG